MTEEYKDQTIHTFICHSGHDSWLVLTVYYVLELLDIHCVLDNATVPTGTETAESVEHALRTARVGLVFIGADFFDRDWCRYEAETLLQRAKDQSCVLVPVFLTPSCCEPGGKLGVRLNRLSGVMLRRDDAPLNENHIVEIVQSVCEKLRLEVAPGTIKGYYRVVEQNIRPYWDDSGGITKANLERTMTSLRQQVATLTLPVSAETIPEPAIDEKQGDVGGSLYVPLLEHTHTKPPSAYSRSKQMLCVVICLLLLAGVGTLTYWLTMEHNSPGVVCTSPPSSSHELEKACAHRFLDDVKELRDLAATQMFVTAFRDSILMGSFAKQLFPPYVCTNPTKHSEYVLDWHNSINDTTKKEDFAWEYRIALYQFQLDFARHVDPEVMRSVMITQHDNTPNCYNPLPRIRAAPLRSVEIVDSEKLRSESLVNFGRQIKEMEARMPN